jgi:transposase-like protein
MSKRKVKKYTDEFKKSSAKLAIESDEPVSHTAKNLGVSSSTLNGWVKSYFPNTQTISHLQADDTQIELKKLKKELDRVKQERDILKKAAAYFANEMR